MTGHNEDEKTATVSDSRKRDSTITGRAVDSERTEGTSALFGSVRQVGNKDGDKGFGFLVEALCGIILIVLAIAYLNAMFGAKPRPSIQESISLTEELPQKSPHSADEPIAKTLFAAKMSSSRLVNDTQVNVAIKEVLSRLRSASVFPWPVRVAILESHDVNASTSGSGYVLLSSGLLAACRTDGELAFVLSHELAHALLKHIPKKMESALSDGQIEELIAFSQSNNAELPPDLIVDDRPSGSITKGSQKAAGSAVLYKNAPADIVKYANSVLLAHYDREQELEADQLGVEMMKKAGYSAGESVSLLLRLPDLSSWFSSNPSKNVRVAAIEQLGPNQSPIQSKRLKFTTSQGGVTNNGGAPSTSKTSKSGETPSGRIIDRSGLNKMIVHSAEGDREIIIEAGSYSEQTPGPTAAVSSN